MSHLEKELNKQIQKEIDNMDIEQIKSRMNALGNDYLNVAERVSKTLEHITDIQLQMQYCVKVLEDRGERIEYPPIDGEGQEKT
jgi:translation initiation factor 6 (eIF-6)